MIFRLLISMIVVFLPFISNNALADNRLELSLVERDVFKEPFRQLHRLLKTNKYENNESVTVFAYPLSLESQKPCSATFVKSQLSNISQSLLYNSQTTQYANILQTVSGATTGNFQNESLTKIAMERLPSLPEGRSLFALSGSASGCIDMSAQEVVADVGISFGGNDWFSTLSKSKSDSKVFKRTCASFSMDVFPAMYPVFKPKRVCIYYTQQQTSKDGNISIGGFFGGSSKFIAMGVDDEIAFDYLMNMAVLTAYAELINVPSSIFLPWLKSGLDDFEVDHYAMQFINSDISRQRELLSLISQNWGGVDYHWSEISSPNYKGTVEKLHAFLKPYNQNRNVKESDYTNLYRALLSQSDLLTKNKKTISIVTEEEYKLIVVAPKLNSRPWKIDLNNIKCSRETCHIPIKRGYVDQYLLDGVEIALSESILNGEVLDGECMAKNKKEFSCSFSLSKGAKLITKDFKRAIKRLARS